LTKPPESGTASSAAWSVGYCEASITAAGGGFSSSAFAAGFDSAAVNHPTGVGTNGGLPVETSTSPSINNTKAEAEIRWSASVMTGSFLAGS
jgi:hypothetical protein